MQIAMRRAPQLIARHFECQRLTREQEAASRRVLRIKPHNKLQKLRQRAADDGSGAFEAVAEPTLDPIVLDTALRNLGKTASTEHRELHAIMRVVNGGAALRGVAEEQTHSEDAEMRAHAATALNDLAV